MHFSEFRTWFNSSFSDLLLKKAHAFSAIGSGVDVLPIASYVASIAQDGKRFRPFLAYCASGLTTDERDKHFLLFAAIELLHIFALIHDDIMDGADTRHGIVSAHKKFTKLYGDTISSSIGILLGDIAFTWAYECLFEYMQAFPKFQSRIIEEYTRLLQEVTHGQLLDILSPAQQPLGIKAIVEKMTLKTARYSFVQPMRIGFIISGDHAADQLFAEAYGISIGIGFQLQDDVLDTLPGSQTGKTRFVDIRSGQQTLISWYMRHHADTLYQEKFLKVFGVADLSPAAEDDLAELLESSGALPYVRTQSEQYFNQAFEAVHTDRQDAQLWQEILNFVRQRKK
ncbi:MAG: polyprenyl synthetase family protein [Candidatus Pacebacteria bacterium]|jgi:geranylgeranyl diphosphate synthase type I|nr:polyprenyl synthetase family protein [Candidatus Paceibacterota bacterium]